VDSRPNISRTPQQGPRLPPCRAGCPSGTDVRGWIAVVSQREKFGYSKDEALRRAWKMIVERNPLPAIMGRICPHPCESGCNRTDKDGAVAVNAMERFVGDWAIKNDLDLPVFDHEDRSETVGVIGSGPAGLSFAYQLARRGYPVTIYERNDESGGMLRYGIPEYRLPRDVLDAEIARILRLGVSLELSTRVGSDITTEDLRARHDVVFLGVGAPLGRKLGIDGEDGQSVYAGVEFLEAYSRKEPPRVGARVAVIGGGNTAIDAARSARRLGADVTILYRRTRAEMPAIDSEIDEAVEEGISIEYLVSPVAIRRDDTGVRGITAIRMELGDEDESGRRRPVPIEDSQFDVPVDSVIVAVAQQPDWVGLAPFRSDGDWASLDDPGIERLGIWAGGDVTGPGIASAAIGHGRLAAERAHAQLRGLPPSSEGRSTGVLSADLNLDYYESSDRLQVPVTEPAARIDSPSSEVSSTITASDFFTEADRCLSCGMCIGCGYCSMFCNADGFARVVEPQPGFHYILMLDRCESCGKCIEVCPCGFISLAPASES
jgi:NADPH-dependent glutamate synthase beta subunit-like oxidoreductase